MPEKLRIAWFSPLQMGGHSEASGAAYLSSEVLPHLFNKFEIDLFHSQAGSWQGQPVQHYLSAWQRHRQRPYDIFSYQLEDSPCCDYIQMHLGLVPGVVCFHDCFSVRTGPAALGNSNWRQSIREFNSGVLETPDEVERSLGCFWRAAGLAGIALFSDPSQRERYRRESPLRLESEMQTLRSSNLLWPVDPAPGAVKVSGDGHTLAYCGAPRVEHRPHKLLEALSGCERAFRLLWLIDREEEAQARALLAEYDLGGVELRLGRTPAAWQALLSKADIAIHSFFSTLGQPGPYFNISLMMGLPCVVTDSQTFEHVSSDLVFKVRPGSTEAVEMREVLQTLYGVRDFPGRAAQRQFAREMFSSEVVAKELGILFQMTAPLMREMMKRSDELRAQKMSRIVEGVREGFAETAGQSPLGAEIVWKLHEPTFKEFGWL